MSLILDGTNGLSDVDGSAATPAIRGTDANTGIFFPAADTIAFSEGGAEAARFDSAGNLGIGTTSPSTMLNLSRDSGLATGSGTTIALRLADTGADGGSNTWNTTQQFTAVQFSSADTSSPSGASIRASVGSTMESTNGGLAALTFFTNSSGTPAERARIDSNGNLLVGTTNANPAGRATNSRIVAIQAGGDSMTLQQSSDSYLNIVSHVTTTSGIRYHIGFGDGTSYGERGVISTNGSSTTYSTSSDYRLKNSIAPMTGALAKVAQLKPVTYKWNSDGSNGEGFIAHELAEICPDAVTGEKDAVDEDGNPKYQGIDTSFLVATLTAAIQEQQALIIQLQADVAALKAV